MYFLKKMVNLLISYAENANWLYAARVITGFIGGAASVHVPIFIAEIASDR